MAKEVKLEAKEEVAIIADEGVNKTTKIHTNLQRFILNLLPELYSIHMTIKKSSVAKIVVKCTKRRWNMDGLIEALHHKDFDSMAKERLLSIHTSYLPLYHNCMRLTLKKKWL